MLEADATKLSFDIFKFRKACKEDELVQMMTYLFQINNLYDALNIESDVFYNFIKKIQSGYHPNPYHNSIHAADVVQVQTPFIQSFIFIRLSTIS